MLRTLTYLLLVVLVHKTNMAQEGLPLIIIKDEVSGTAVQGVHVEHLPSGQVRVSDEQGQVDLHGWVLPAQLRFTHVAYEARKVKVKPDSGPILLRPRMIMLDPVQVGRDRPEVVYELDQLHVGAYHINSDGLWVLVHQRSQLWHRQENAGAKVLMGSQLHLLDTSLKFLAARNVPMQITGWHRDHRHRLIMEGAGRALVATVDQGQLLFRPLDPETLHKAVLFWQDSVNGHFFGNDLTRYYPAFHHYAYSVERDTILRICEIADDELVRMFRSTYKYMSGRDKVRAMDMERETGMDREVIAGMMTRFYDDIYYDTPYAPLFIVGDTVMVFDHCKGSILRYDAALHPAGEVPIQYHLEKGWKRTLLQDAVDGSIHALHSRHGRTTLRKIDLHTGAVVNEFHIRHPYAEEIQVHGGHVWYVHREYGTTQKRTLYRERITPGHSLVSRY